MPAETTAEEAVEAMGTSTLSLITVAIKQGPSAVISIILCWGIFVTVPGIITQFSHEQDELRSTFSSQADLQRQWFSNREEARDKMRSEEFKQIIFEQKDLTKTLSETNALIRDQQTLLRDFHKP